MITFFLVPVPDSDWKDLKEGLDKLDVRLTCALQNGLFVDNDAALQPIRNDLKDIRTNLVDKTEAHYPGSVDKLYNCENALREKEKKATRWWRFYNQYAVHIWIYLIFFIVLVFLFYVLHWDKIVSGVIGVDQIAIGAAVWGIMGGLLRGLWKLWYSVNRGQYRHVWLIYFISSPFLGGILGSITYLLVKSGLALFSGHTNNLTNSPEAIWFVAAFAGYSWEWAVSIWTTTAESLHKSGSS
jgi:hypothetical protein